jgi:hypothetical protein
MIPIKIIPIKINCACGQRYAFDIEPVNGRMPAPVACPVCGVHGTAAANDIIAQNMHAAPPPPLAGGATVVSMSAGQGAAMLARHLASATQRSSGGSEGRNWKWWYFVLAGICIGGYSIWQAYSEHQLKPLGSLFLAVLCIAIGIWDFFYQRKKKQMGS